MKYQITQYSLRGARATNEDRVGYAERDNAVLLAVADGLGGHRGGEVASEILVQTMMHGFQSLRQPMIERPSAFLALGILQAHHAIIAHGQAALPPMDPRTTCVVCLVQNGYAYWAHVGDSRLYLIRQNHVLLRTQDHTAIEEMHQGGLLTEEEMLEHPQKSHLLNCLGGGIKPKISMGEETLLQPGDMLLVCSDGLWEAFTPEEITRYLKAPALDEAVENMLNDAVRKMKQGCDNVSAICLRWEDAISKSAPLQGNTALEIDEEKLREEARHHLPRIVRRPAQKPAALTEDANDDRKKPLQERIQEIEDFLKKFEA
ncbi:MAG: protein phosphatase 2C domain-containing protein [Gammaproteobacteria bacterium]|nr:protein phosphatase 2C domain-containing protein [Gammaproteobacteria bacterium]MDH3371099.1 protein phosphatase 2C domain-containing protein [Gammaproteobacteria bacterium]MDH3407578.1 protein phosphatase 2C domain-containing protein [Gammaproteobacteria bacterium]MDH3561829.1 protein phosphatase 2C domain-containing protein [Gammaproteobacteria bacterium]MDH5486609.1 protein phosphatase 2C domain-containing protein [Gammaproteobacteria bacterium]